MNSRMVAFSIAEAATRTRACELPGRGADGRFRGPPLAVVTRARRSPIPFHRDRWACRCSRLPVRALEDPTSARSRRAEWRRRPRGQHRDAPALRHPRYRRASNSRRALPTRPLKKSGLSRVSRARSTELAKVVVDHACRRSTRFEDSLMSVSRSGSIRAKTGGACADRERPRRIGSSPRAEVEVV